MTGDMSLIPFQQTHILSLIPFQQRYILIPYMTVDIYIPYIRELGTKTHIYWSDSSKPVDYIPYIRELGPANQWTLIPFQQTHILIPFQQTGGHICTIYKGIRTSTHIYWSHSSKSVDTLIPYIYQHSHMAYQCELSPSTDIYICIWAYAYDKYM